MRLRITTPTDVPVDRDVTHVQAEDPSGRFGVLEGHERYLTATVPSIIIYRYSDGGGEREGYVAVRHGVLRVTGDTVEVAVREAHVGNDLAALQEEMRASRERREKRSYRSTRSLYQMQIGAWRRLVEYGDARTR